MAAPVVWSKGLPTTTIAAHVIARHVEFVAGARGPFQGIRVPYLNPLGRAILRGAGGVRAKRANEI